MKQQQLWNYTLQNRSGSPDSPTAPWLSAGLLAVQSGTKTHILNYTMLLRRLRGTCDFEASWYLQRALLELSWGYAQLAGAGSSDGRNTYSNVFNLLLFHYIRYPHTWSIRWIFWSWPDATYRMPLLSWILDCPPPTHSLIHTCKNLSHNLWTRRSLHVAPRFRNSTTCDAVRDCCRFSQQSDARVRREVSLSEMLIPQEIPHAKQSTTHFIFANHHTLQIDDELLTGIYWPAYNESC